MLVEMRTIVKIGIFFLFFSIFPRTPIAFILKYKCQPFSYIFVKICSLENNVNNVNNVNNGFLPMMHKLSVVTTAHVQLKAC